MARIPARLAEPTHRLRMPGGSRYFGDGTEGVERVDPEAPVWAPLFADGSLVKVEETASKNPNDQTPAQARQAQKDK